jgi:hypothetical protein
MLAPAVRPIRLAALAAAILLPAGPTAAQARLPVNGEEVECPISTVFDGSAYVVRCTDRWGGMLVPVSRVNGYSGFMFRGPMAADYVCYSDAVITVQDHPEPLADGFLTCKADWSPEDELELDCRQ